MSIIENENEYQHYTPKCQLKCFSDSNQLFYKLEQSKIGYDIFPHIGYKICGKNNINPPYIEKHKNLCATEKYFPKNCKILLNELTQDEIITLEVKSYFIKYLILNNIRNTVNNDIFNLTDNKIFDYINELKKLLYQIYRM